MRFESKKEMAKALMDGRRFRNLLGREIFFDANERGNPFRFGGVDMQDTWGKFADEWTEIPPWYENIPEHGVLCWVWDDDDEDKAPIVITRKSLAVWANSEPMTLKEVQKYIYQEPEK